MQSRPRVRSGGQAGRLQPPAPVSPEPALACVQCQAQWWWSHSQSRLVQRAHSSWHQCITCWMFSGDKQCSALHPQGVIVTWGQGHQLLERVREPPVSGKTSVENVVWVCVQSYLINIFHWKEFRDFLMLHPLCIDPIHSSTMAMLTYLQVKNNFHT